MILIESFSLFKTLPINTSDSFGASVLVGIPLRLVNPT